MIYLPENFYEQILRDGEKSFPNESCGVLFGRLLKNGAKEILSCRSVLNEFASAERYHRFEISAEIMMKLELEARRNKFDIAGFYHSHPNAAAVPSEFDRSHALPIYSYVITSVVEGAAERTTCWILNEKNIFVEEVINIGDSFNSDDA